MIKSLLCIGFGYSAQALAARLPHQEYWVLGTTRSARLVGLNDALMYQTGQVDDALITAINNASHILISVAPDARGCPVFADIGDMIAQARSLKWLGYLSTTGVYGDHKGAWINENTSIAPLEPRSVARALAEQQWLAHHTHHNTPTHIFRLSGIYGIGRSALDSVRAGTAQRIDAGNHVFSRIHVDDIALALHASMQQVSAGEIYNVADDEPASSSDMMEYACELLGVAPPPFVLLADAQMSEMARSFYRAHRRVSSEKIKKALDIKWQYPSYKQGLEAILVAEQLKSS